MAEPLRDAKDVAREWLEQGRENATLWEPSVECLTALLERERAAAQQECDTSIAEVVKWGATHDWRENLNSIRLKLRENAGQIVTLIHERDEVRAKGDALAEALEALLKEAQACDQRKEGITHRAFLNCDKASAALAEWRNP